MPRQKKDGRYLNLKIDADIYNRFAAYAEEQGQTKTMALERILKQFLDEHDIGKDMEESGISPEEKEKLLVKLKNILD